jgi:hypothetical protein
MVYVGFLFDQGDPIFQEGYVRGISRLVFLRQVMHLLTQEIAPSLCICIIL